MGAPITCTAAHSVVQADLDAGSVVNVATGHGFYGATTVTSNEDTVTVSATQTPALSLTKVANAGNVRRDR